MPTMSLLYTYPACMAQCSTDFFIVSYKPMLNVSIIASVPIRIYILLCLLRTLPYHGGCRSYSYRAVARLITLRALN